MTTLLERLVQAAARFGDKPALREKRLGIWHELSFNDFLAQVRSPRPSKLVRALVPLMEDARHPHAQAQGELFSLSLEDTALYAAALDGGLCVSFPEKPQTLLSDLREIGPHSLFAPASFWEDLHRSVQTKMAAAVSFNQFVYRRLLPRAGWFARVALKNPLRDRLGLSRIRHATSFGKLPSDALQFFRAIEVPLEVP